MINILNCFTGVHPCCSRKPNLFALAQHTQITWTDQLKCDKHYSVDRWMFGLHNIIIQHKYMDN